MLTTSLAFLIARASVAVTFAWFAVMNFTSVGEATVGNWLGGHPLFLESENSMVAACAVGIYQAILALLIIVPIRNAILPRMGFYMLAAYSAGALSLLFTNPVWIDSLGGFPAIGAGQGLIKYVSVLGLGLWGAAVASAPAGGRSGTGAVGRQIMAVGIILVLVWIGVMKFTLPEAQGVDPLLKTSPFFSWMQNFFSMQMSSIIIGVIELITAALLVGWWFSRPLFLAGAILCAATFVTTLSFLVTFAPAWSADLGGFPALGGAGHFLLKDLLMLSATLALASSAWDSAHR